MAEIIFVLVFLFSFFFCVCSVFCFFLPASSVSLSQYWVFCHFLDSLSASNLNLSCLLYLPDLLLFPCFLPSLLPPPFSPSSLLPPLQVVQDLLPLIFQLRRWFPRCPNCSSLCFQCEMRRRSWDLRRKTSRSADGPVQFPGSLVLSLLHICNRYNITFLFFKFYF